MKRLLFLLPLLLLSGAGSARAQAIGGHPDEYDHASYWYAYLSVRTYPTFNPSAGYVPQVVGIPVREETYFAACDYEIDVRINGAGYPLSTITDAVSHNLIASTHAAARLTIYNGTESDTWTLIDGQVELSGDVWVFTAGSVSYTDGDPNPYPPVPYGDPPTTLDLSPPAPENLPDDPNPTDPTYPDDGGDNPPIYPSPLPAPGPSLPGVPL